MKPDELLGLVKGVLRVSSDVYNDEIQLLIDSAIADMKRVGVREVLLTGEVSPLCARAICCFCKGQFGFDNDDAAFFMDSYRQATIDLMNSDANECSGDTDEV